MNRSKQSISKGLVSTFATGLHDEAGPVLWARCSAQLTRQALKVALDEFWQRRAPGVKSGSRHSPSLWLGNDLADDQLAAHVSHTQSALGSGCHYHSYELVPTARELEGWIETVRNCAQSLATASAQRASEHMPPYLYS